MTQDEFQRWFRHHAANFTGIVAWLGKLPKTADAGMPSQLDVTTAWFRQLASLDIETAIAASDELATTAEQYQPRSFDRHPATVAAIAKRLRRDAAPEHQGPRYVDGRETFKCATCQDTGAVTVWHPKTMALAAAGKLAPTMQEAVRTFQIYECAVRCTCEASKGLGYIPTVYSPETMLPVKPCQPHEQQLAEVTAFAQGLAERRAASRRHSEFDQYSGRDRAAGF